MPSVPARAYAFADTFRLKELQPAFAPAEVRVEKDELVARFPDGTAIAYDFGAVVFFGCEAERDAVVQALLKRIAPEPHAPLTEELTVETDPQAQPAVEARFDKVIVRELSEAVRGIIALTLAQSAAMDYYDEDVAEILGKSEQITKELQLRGRMRGRVKDIVKFIGSCIHTKNGIIETLALFDKPDTAWEEEAVDKLYMQLRKVLEIDDRFRNLEYKLRMIQENLVLLVDLTRQRHTFYLEAAVMLLILFEVMVMVWQVLGGKT